jgi:hypothetical protein
MRPIPSEVTASLPAAPEIAVQAAPIAEPPGNPLARITGTVTDPTGAVISSANVVLRQRAGALSTSVQTDSQGRFEVADLPPGQYELRIGAPGFREESRRVELQPQEVAAVTSQLSIGSVSETVEVTAAPPQIQTESSSMSQSRVRTLPNKLPIAFSVESGKVMLAVDSAGKLFRSGNSGKSWKAIKAIWSGKVARLELADTATAQFRLTTDSEAVWLSRDGSRWFAASR